MNATMEPPTQTAAGAPASAGFTRWIPLILTVLFAGWFASKVRVEKDNEWAISQFGRIPLVVDGRHMPMDTFTRSALILIREREAANLEPWKKHTDDPKIVTAAEWGLEVMTKPEEADKRPVFRIDHPDVKGLFGVPMEANPAALSDGKHYSWNQLQPRWREFEAEVRRASSMEAKSQSAYEQALMKLWKATRAYKKLKLTFGPAATGDLSAGLADFNGRISKWREAMSAQMNGEEPDPEVLMWGEENRQSAPLIAPRKGAERAGDTVWASPFEEVLAINRGEPAPTLANYAKIAATYRGGDHAGFAAAVGSHIAALEMQKGFAADLKKASREQLFNHAAPFYWGTGLAVISALLGISYWFSPARMEWARRSAVWILVLTMVIHTGGLIVRYMIEGKPPVTNLYTSAIFIGWGATILGLMMERLFPFSVGVVVASAVEFASLIIAHYLAQRDGTTFTVLEAVLNTNFWLATHVVIVTLGYTATFIGGFLGILYVCFGAFSNRLGLTLSELKEGGAESKGKASATLGRALTTMIYAITCFAALFSFVGTVLGGLWADQSWGRFWGWDVKENGALMIVLWNALILHARWGGLVRERGIACMAIFGNVVTAWSWFGVNNLSIGLHSYGFTSGVFWVLLIFVISQLALIALAGGPMIRSFAVRFIKLLVQKS